MNKWLGVALLATGTIAGQGTMAEEACKTTQLKNLAPTLSERIARMPPECHCRREHRRRRKRGETMTSGSRRRDVNCRWSGDRRDLQEAGRDARIHFSAAC
jgi:hypothetical protein